MNANEARKVVYDAFIAGWPTAFPAVPFALDNEKLDPPDPTEFVTCVVRQSESDQHTLAPIGQRIFDRRGLVFVQVYTAVDSGLRRLDDLAKAARDLFEGKTLSGVYFFVADYREGGQVNGRSVGTVAIPFSYDETK